MEKRGILLSGSSGWVGASFYNRLMRRTDVKVKCVGRTVTSDVFWKDLSLDAFKDVDYVYHLAGTTDLWSIRKNERFHNETNIGLSEKIFSLFLYSDAVMFVYMSTVKVMGEGGGKAYTMDDLPRPETVYAKSKLLAEESLNLLWHNFKLDNPSSKKQFVILRPAMIFDTNKRGNLWFLWSWTKFGLPVFYHWLPVKRSMVNLSSLLDFMEQMAGCVNLKSCYFVLDGPLLSLGDILCIMEKEHGKRIKVISMNKYFVRLFSFFDRFLLMGRINWLFKRLETDFIVNFDSVEFIEAHSLHDILKELFCGFNVKDSK